VFSSFYKRQKMARTAPSTSSLIPGHTHTTTSTPPAEAHQQHTTSSTPVAEAHQQQQHTSSSSTPAAAAGLDLVSRPCSDRCSGAVAVPHTQHFSDRRAFAGAGGSTGGFRADRQTITSTLVQGIRLGLSRYLESTSLDLGVSFRLSQQYHRVQFSDITDIERLTTMQQQAGPGSGLVAPAAGQHPQQAS
jgi:hypothetical protein